MLARREFRNYAPVRLMRGNLRRHHVRDKLLSRAHHSRSSFVTGTFNAENVSVGHETIVLDLCQSVHLSGSGSVCKQGAMPNAWAILIPEEMRLTLFMSYTPVILVILFIAIACPIAALRGLRRGRSKQKISN